MERPVVECAFGICASKWRILDKATETKVNTGTEIVKCIALMHNIITNFEGLHDLPSNNHGSLGAKDGTQLKKSRIHNSVTALPHKRETYFANISTVQLVMYRGKRELLETCSNSKSSLHYVIT